MKLSRCISLALLGLSVSPLAWSATVIESKSPMGETQRVLLNGSHARMESDSPDGYMLMSLKDKTMYAVDNKQKQIVDMSAKPKNMPAMPKMPQMPDMPGGLGKAPPVEAKLVDKGDGPEIAGYATRHYQITANGAVCSDEYVSVAALDVAHVKDFTDSMISRDGKDDMPPMPFMQMNPCMEAEVALDKELGTKGLHMRSVDKDGEVVHEISRIQADVDTPAEAFSLPQGYSQTTAFEMMQKAMQNMSPGRGAPGQ